MQFPQYKHQISGVVIPLSALRSTQSCGIGEFLDLIPFADFCAKATINLIQLLPVNDTGTESSPYSALSAFALHPIYICLQELPESQGFEKHIRALRQKHEQAFRFSYNDIRSEKISLLKMFYNGSKETIIKDKKLQEWIKTNQWIIEYAVYMNLKNNNFDASWKEWNKHRTPTKKEIKEMWLHPQTIHDHMFFAWVQMRLDEQFKTAVHYCVKKGIALKGDIPIMMNEDSCDAWSKPEFFRDDLRAGNPPDGENPLGQNWGFPIYNWENLKEDNYSWWIQRLKHCEQYYHAYRIDHILGFFRIWAIPYGEKTGYLGWPIPHEPITSKELAEIGFSGNRLRWLCEPHIPTQKIEAVHNYDYLGTHGILRTLMNRIGEEELWLFKKTIKRESDIWETTIPDPVKKVLSDLWRDRMLLKTGRTSSGKELYVPIWTFRDSTAWKSLNDQEKQSFINLVVEKNKKNEILWEKQAKELLQVLTSSVDMAPCAEDLGSIPETVPKVLADLKIYSLKVFRWERKWSEPNKPFKKIIDYPKFSVTTTSVHDSSTLKDWWENEDGARAFINNCEIELSMDSSLLKQDGQEFKAPPFSPEIAKKVLSYLADTSSALFILPIQDYFSLVQDYQSANAEQDRINVPGTVNSFNWTYRIPVRCEQLSKNQELVEAIQLVLQKRKQTKI